MEGIAIPCVPNPGEGQHRRALPWDRRGNKIIRDGSKKTMLWEGKGIPGNRSHRTVQGNLVEESTLMQATGDRLANAPGDMLITWEGQMKVFSLGDFSQAI